MKADGSKKSKIRIIVLFSLFILTAIINPYLHDKFPTFPLLLIYIPIILVVMAIVWILTRENGGKK